MNKIKLFIVILFVFLISCKKENEDFFSSGSTHAADAFNRTIKVWTYHLYDQENLIDTILPFVEVALYETEEDAIYQMNEKAIRITDSNGYCIFEGRDKSEYWVTASKGLFNVQLQNVSTPNNTISFVEFYFY